MHNFRRVWWQASCVEVEKKRCQDGSLCDAMRPRKLFGLLLLVVRVKLLLPTSSMIMRTMCLSGSNRSSLQVRPWCDISSKAAVRSTNTAPANFLAEKLQYPQCLASVRKTDLRSTSRVESPPVFAGIMGRWWVEFIWRSLGIYNTKKKSLQLKKRHSIKKTEGYRVFVLDCCISSIIKQVLIEVLHIQWERAARRSTKLRRECWFVTGLSWWIRYSDPLGSGSDIESVDPTAIKLCPGCHNPFASSKLYNCLRRL